MFTYLLFAAGHGKLGPQPEGFQFRYEQKDCIALIFTVMVDWA